MDEVITAILIIGALLSSFLILPIIILVKISGIRKDIAELKLRKPVDRSVNPAPAPIDLSIAPIRKVVTEVIRQPVLPPPLPPASIGQDKEVPLDRLKYVADKCVKVASVTTAETRRSKLAESVNEILGKMWNWFLFGAEQRPKDVTIEYAIASTWLPRIGIGAIAMCAAYFLVWSNERNLIPDYGRVAISITVGVGMLVAGIKLLGKKYHIIGQGLLGGGILVLYFSVFAASPMMYGLLSMIAAFGLMILVTIAAGFLAVRTNSLLIAIIGIAGGFMTPGLLSAPDQYLYAFYAYILMLNLGILGVAHYKQWRLLNYLGFLFTYVMFIGSLTGQYDKQRHFVGTISFLSVLFVIHSSLVYIYNILKAKNSTVLEIIHLVANAGLFAGIAYWLIAGKCGGWYPAILSLGLAVFFVLHVLVFLKKKLVDRNLLIALIALAGIFTAWTLPLVFEKESLTISFSLFALLLLWLSQKISSNFLQNLGYLAYVVVFYRLLVLDMPRNFDFKPIQAATMTVYWEGMAQRIWTFGTSIASVLIAFFLQRGKIKVANTTLNQGNDIPSILQRNTATQVFYWSAVMFLFVFLHLELNTMFCNFMPLRLPVLTILWCVMAGYFLFKYITDSENNAVMFNVMIAFLMLTFLKVFVFDLRSWNFCGDLFYNMEYSIMYAGMRLMDFGAVLAIFFVAWLMLMGKGGDQKKIAHGFGYGGLLLFFVYMSLEINTLLYWKQPDFQAGGISVLWAIFAISFISCGIWKDIKSLRFMGLILFVVVAGKAVMVDLKDMDMIYRVVAFMVLGITLLIGSFAYIRSSKKFLKETSNDSQDK